MREPLTDLEKDLAKLAIEHATERDHYRKTIARALKALDKGDVQEGRTILYNSL